MHTRASWVFMLAPWLAALGCSTSPAMDRSMTSGIAIHPGGSPVEIIVGDIPQAGSASVPVGFTNRMRRRIDVAKVDISCECITIEGLARDLSAGERTQAMLKVDLGSKPSFIGDLAGEISGMDQTGRTLFQIVVRAHVRATNVGVVAYEEAPQPVPMPYPSESEMELP
jgi:hypothetical protein